MRLRASFWTLSGYAQRVRLRESVHRIQLSLLLAGSLLARGFAIAAAQSQPASSAQPLGSTGDSNSPRFKASQMVTSVHPARVTLSSITNATDNPKFSEGIRATARQWTAEFRQPGAQFGFSVAGGGDFNGDGFPDVVIGAKTCKSPEISAGAICVYFGSASGLSPTIAYYGEGGQEKGLYGSSVAFFRDVNGDGLADLVAGRPGRGGGQVLLLMGTRGPIGNPVLLSPGARFAGGLFGCSVSSAGDVNGDGLDDILVGASRSGRDHYREGAAFVFHGSKAGLFGIPTWRALGGWKRAYLGKSVAAAGDVNGDGFGDVLVGAPEYSGLKEQAGRAMLFLGSTNGLSEQPAWIADGSRPFAALGSAVTSAGDVNHDGYADILIGAPGVESQSAPPGQAFLFLGSRSGPRKEPDWIAEGAQPFSRFGAAVSTARDVNGDGFDDVVVGAPMHREKWQEEGRVALYLGTTNGPERTPIWTADGGQFEARLGWAVASAGDVNRDGMADFIVGAPFYDCGKKDEGRVDVFYGSSTGYQRVTNIVSAPVAQASPLTIPGATHSKTPYLVLVCFAGLFAATAWYWGKKRQETAALRERQRLARDLHDGLGTDLAQLSLLGGRASGADEQPAIAPSSIDDLPARARDMMRTMEEIVWATNPANDTLENTVTFLGQYSERLFGGTSIRAFQEIPVELPEHVLPGHVRKNILLAVKEALENSLKHSKATEVWLRVACENAVLRIVIEDNGCGFATDSTRRFGNGLANMKARMEEVQAHCEIASRPGNGTRVELRIELALS